MKLKPIERSEASIEKSDKVWLKAQGYEPRKFRTIAMSAAPDQIVFADLGGCFFIEFKRIGKDATPLQKDYHKMLRERGFVVGVSHGREETKAIAAEFEVQRRARRSQ